MYTKDQHKHLEHLTHLKLDRFHRVAYFLSHQFESQDHLNNDNGNSLHSPDPVIVETFYEQSWRLWQFVVQGLVPLWYYLKQSLTVNGAIGEIDNYRVQLTLCKAIA